MFAMPILSSGINMCLSSFVSFENDPFEIIVSLRGWKVGREVSEDLKPRAMYSFSAFDPLRCRMR